MSVLDGWYDRARQRPQHIVLADGADGRAQQAATQLERDGLAEVTLVADAVDHHSPAVLAAAAALTKPVDLNDPLVVSTLMVAAGEADGCVAGATRPTPDVIRAGIRILGTAPGTDLVSSCFLLVLPDDRVLVYGDCGLVPEPDETQLASIAIECAASYRQLAGDKPWVAMLSFSTMGSAEHPRVQKVRNATSIARQRSPNLAVDGEMQFDTAWVDEIAASKAPGSAVAGRANVFVFPDLDSGNIAYKITERLAGARAFGPLLQGLNGVLHDLSRGCSADDIVNVAVIAAVQAQDRTHGEPGADH